MTDEERERLKHGKLIAGDVTKVRTRIIQAFEAERVPMHHWPWVLTMLAGQELGIHTTEWQALKARHRHGDFLERVVESGETGLDQHREEVVQVLVKSILSDGRYFTARLLGYLSMGLREIQQAQDTEAALEQTLKTITD